MAVQTRFKQVQNEVWQMESHPAVVVITCMPDSTGNVTIRNEQGEELILIPGMSFSLEHRAQSREPLTIDATGDGTWAQVAWEN